MASIISPTLSRTFLRSARLIPKQPRLQPITQFRMAASQTIATYDVSLGDRLPPTSRTLFDAKAKKGLTFAEIGKALGRDEVAVAAVFYGQHQTNDADITALSKTLDLDEGELKSQLQGFPFRGHVTEMPPKEPLIYRLYEIVQNYGYAYKAILNEKFGDGIMSAISFSTKVEKETDEKGDWVKITLRGKWLPYTRF